MPTLSFPLVYLARTQEDERLLGELLHFPELSRYHDDQERLLKQLKEQQRLILETTALPSLPRASLPTEPSLLRVEVELPLAEDRLSTLLSPIKVTVHAATWTHPRSPTAVHHLAYVPSLSLEVRADDAATLETRIQREVSSTLLRLDAFERWQALVAIERTTDLHIETFLMSLTLPSAKQITQKRLEAGETRKVSELQKACTKLKSANMPRAFELDAVVGRMAESLASASRSSVLLVGPSGVGKTAAFHELVRDASARGLKGREFYATSGARLVAGQTGFGMWQNRCLSLVQEAGETKAILYVGSLVELMEVGQSARQSENIASFLRPFIARGELQVIAECTPEQLSLIDRQNAQMLGAFQQIVVQEPTQSQVLSILLNYALTMAAAGRPALEEPHLELLERLHRRYAASSAWPGRSLRFMRNLLEGWERFEPITLADVTAAFARETGLPLLLLDDQLTLDAQQIRAWFEARVIGQPQAITEVIDLLTLVKANLTRPRKPLASLMFIGPTGVGKTQLARSLAEFLFQSGDRLTRFDMSEYASSGAVERLIGGAFGAEGLLTSKVREQPFSVLLFDECEKAHPLFFDLLLQIMGDGRLTDAGGRLADFCNTVIILTSNLGAEGFSRASLGFVQASARKKAQEHFDTEVRAFLRPEIYNRLDRILPFLPLEPDVVQLITRRELQLIQRRPGIEGRNLLLSISPEVEAYLAKRGYDVRYGARPLKRTLEQELLVPLANALNAYAWQQPLEATVSVVGEGAAEAERLKGERLKVERLKVERLKVEVKGRQSRTQQQEKTLHGHFCGLGASCTAFRREVATVDQGGRLLEMRNSVTRLQGVVAREKREALQKLLSKQRLDGSSSKSKASAKSVSRLEQSLPETAAQKELAGLQGILTRLAGLWTEVCALEDEVLLSTFVVDLATLSSDAVKTFEAQHQKLKEQWARWIEQASEPRVAQPHRIGLGFFCPDTEMLGLMLTAYNSVWTTLGLTPRFMMVKAGHIGLGDEKEPRKVLDDFTKLDFVTPQQAIGVLVEVQGPMAFLRLENEVGFHNILTGTGRSMPMEVRRFEDELLTQIIPPELARSLVREGRKERRRYRLGKNIVEDVLLNTSDPFPERRLDAALNLILDRTYRRSLRRWVGLEGY